MKVCQSPSRLCHRFWLIFGLMIYCVLPFHPNIHAQETAIPLEYADLPEGTTPELIIEIYGSPLMKVDIPNSAEEIWSYPNKNIVLENSVLKIIDRSPDHHFGVGSSQLEIILAQGFPEKIFYIDTLGQEIWHYQTAFITLKDNIVIEWVDHDRILNLTKPIHTELKTLTIGQSKEQIIDMLGYPQSLQQFPALHEELWHYEDYYLTIKNGILNSFSQQERDAREFREIFENDGNPETTESLKEIAANLGLQSATDTVSHPTQTISNSGYWGIFKHDGDSKTKEHLGSLHGSNVEIDKKVINMHQVQKPTNVKHFLGLTLTGERKNISPVKPKGALAIVKETTKVQQIFGFNFYR